MVTLAEELERNPELRMTDLNLLKEWYSKQSHLPHITDELLVLFLHSCYYSPEPTKLTLDKYFTLRTQAPEIFHKRDPNEVDIKHGIRVTNCLLLPQLTELGYSVAMFHITPGQVMSVDFLESYRAYTMTTDLYLHQHGTSEGFVVVIDLHQVTIGLLPRINISHLRTILVYMQEALPIRLKAVHFINVTSLMDIVMATLKPFMKKGLMDTLHFHSNLESLYEFVPKNILPQEYGGSEKSLAVLSAMTLDNLKKNTEWLLECDKRRVDEEKRFRNNPNSNSNDNNAFGIEGSFRKLIID